MAKININDNFGLSADLTIRDDSPLAKAKGGKLVVAAVSLAMDFTAPLNQINFKRATFGGAFNEPDVLVKGAASLALDGAVTGVLSVAQAADQTLFGRSGISALDVSIAIDECWVGIELDAALTGSLSANADGFGLAIADTTSVSFATYSLVKASGASFPLFNSALSGALENFSVTLTPGSIGSQKAGTVNVTGTAGTVRLSGSYSLPIDVKPFASATIPGLNYGISVNPSPTVQVSGSIAVTGQFEVRSHKVSDSIVHLGLYKKKGTTLTAAFTATAGLQAMHKTTDLIASVLGAVFGRVDLQQSGITDENAAGIQEALNDGLDHSLSVALNLECSASNSDEAAVAYSIDFSQGDPAKTETALASALRGDWTALDALSNAQVLRNIIRHTTELKHKLAINLLGIYNAVSVADFVRSCTILHSNGEIVITDKATANQIAASAELYRADPDKLQKALSAGFIATATYAASMGHLESAFTVSQSYLFYKKSPSKQDMREQLLLACKLGCMTPSDMEEIISGADSFSHVRLSITASYPSGAALSLFFASPEERTPFTMADLEARGRSIISDLIDPASDCGPARRAILANNSAWNLMDQNGNPASFSSIPQLAALTVNERADVGADWVDIRWWSKAITQMGARLKDLFSILDQAGSGDPAQNPAFMASRENVAKALAEVTKETHAAFVGGWGLAVMFALSGSIAGLTLDFLWNGSGLHFQKAGSQGSAGAAGS